VSGPQVFTAPASAYWASYLVNGDSSGLDAREIALADRWQAEHAPAYVVDVERDESGEAIEKRFSWQYGAITGDSESVGGELLDYVMHAPAGAPIGESVP
jgi:hypothetical protein